MKLIHISDIKALSKAIIDVITKYKLTFFKQKNKCLLPNVIVYAPKSWEIFAVKFFPYYIPFLTKRQRVRMRSYFRNRWRKRLANAFTSLMKTAYANNNAKKLDLDWSIEDYECEIITNIENEKINNVKKYNGNFKDFC